MKKINYLAIMPLFAAVTMISSCSVPVVGESGNMSNVEESINKIVATDYRETVKNISYYTIEKRRENFVVPQSVIDKNPNASITNIGFRDVSRQRVTRIDFTDSNDLYFYDYSTYEIGYIYAFDSKSGVVSAEKHSYSVGTQFYKKDNKYYFEFSGTKGIGAYKSLHLNKYPYLDADELSSLETAVSKATNGLSLEDGTSLFNKYLKKIAEHDFRINMDIVNDYENDKTGIYNYKSNDKDKFVINGNEKCDFNYLETKTIENEDGTVSYDSFQTNTLVPTRISKAYIDDNFEPIIENVVKVQKNNWITLEEKAANPQSRYVNLNYTRGGWLESGKVKDERTSYNTYTISEGAEYIISDLYIYADFNIVMPHVYGK